MATIDESGAATVASKVARELTDPKRMGEWLSVSEQFQPALEAAPTAMIMIDPHGLMVLTNGHLEKLFGYDRAELMGKSIEVLVPERFHHDLSRFRDDFFGIRRPGLWALVETCTGVEKMALKWQSKLV